MKHLDEGTLQAWLDMPRSGLDASEVAEIERHLAACETCAVALEGLRGSDDGVHALLAGGLDREMERPPFEDVVARAEGRPEEGHAERGGTDHGGMDARRGLSRLNRLAWAASIVVALGVGWVTNEMYRAGPPSPTVRAPVAPVSEPEAQVAAEAPARVQDEAERAQDAGRRNATADQDGRPAAGLSAPAGADEAQAEAAPPATPSAAVTADAAASRVDTDAGSGADDAATSAAPAPDAQPMLRYERQRSLADDTPRAASAASPEPALADTRQAVDAVTRSPETQAASATLRPVLRGVVRDSASGEPVASAQVFVEDLAIGAMTDRNGSYMLLLPPADSMDVELSVQRIGYRPETREVEVAGGAPSIVDFTLQEEALQLQEVIVTGTAGATQRRALANSVESLSAVSVYDWRPETRASVEEKLGRPLLTVPDLEILSIESAEVDEPGVEVLVRIRQATAEDGTVLTLVEGPSDESRDQWDILSEGALESTRRAGVLITGTFTLSPAYLRTLLESIR